MTTLNDLLKLPALEVLPPQDTLKLAESWFGMLHPWDKRSVADLFRELGDTEKTRLLNLLEAYVLLKEPVENAPPDQVVSLCFKGASIALARQGGRRRHPLWAGVGPRESTLGFLTHIREVIGLNEVPLFNGDRPAGELVEFSHTRVFDPEAGTLVDRRFTPSVVLAINPDCRKDLTEVALVEVGHASDGTLLVLRRNANNRILRWEESDPEAAATLVNDEILGFVEQEEQPRGGGTLTVLRNLDGRGLTLEVTLGRYNAVSMQVRSIRDARIEVASGVVEVRMTREDVVPMKDARTARDHFRSDAMNMVHAAAGGLAWQAAGPHRPWRPDNGAAAPQVAPSSAAPQRR